MSCYKKKKKKEEGEEEEEILWNEILSHKSNKIHAKYVCGNLQSSKEKRSP